MRAGERQVASDLNGIRGDHVQRYRWAARTLKRMRVSGRVVDLACGVGYGSKILAEAGFRVVAIDRDAEAIGYAKQHYAHRNIEFRVGSAHDVDLPRCAAAVCFETIEHIEDPSVLLRTLASHAPVLLASVPNEEKFPWRNYKFHFRHYTRRQFADLLGSSGFAVEGWYGQEGEESEVAKGVNGRTTIVVAKRAKAKKARTEAVDLGPVGPGTVAILGLGPSLENFVQITKRMGSTKRLCDEVWGINAVCDVIKCDRGFHLDDIRVQEMRAAANPTGNIAAMLPWMKKHPGPIYTSVPHPDYPGLVAYPLAEVLNACANQRYFNSTAAYAIAMAIMMRVKKMYIFGFDFSYEHSHHAERGRGCAEFWLGFARARGIELAMPKETSLLDACEPAHQRFYGYDGVALQIEGLDGQETVKMAPRVLPTAEEIEARYDHTQPTVPTHLRGR